MQSPKSRELAKREMVENVSPPQPLFRRPDIQTTTCPSTCADDDVASSASRLTALVPDAGAVPEAESFIRLKSSPALPAEARAFGGSPSIAWIDAEVLLDELCEDQLRLSSSLLALERACLEAGRPENPTSQAALRAIDGLLTELRAVRDALAMVQMAALPSSVHPALLSDAPLSEYLRGVFAWMHAIVRAVADLVSGIVHREPAWSLYRWRVEEAKNFHFFELEAAIRADFDALLADGVDVLFVARLGASFDALLQQACTLEGRLDGGLG
jgi:hypothetical protein